MDSLLEKRKKKNEFFASLSLLVILSIIWGLFFNTYRHNTDVMQTSIDKEVVVTGKKPGGGKRNPRIVYIRDGAIPVGVKTSGRWYFETEIGKKTVVKYSPKYHEYRQPYFRSGREKFMMWYIGAIHIAVTARAIWLWFQVWQKNKSGSAEAQPDQGVTF